MPARPPLLPQSARRRARRAWRRIEHGIQSPTARAALGAAALAVAAVMIWRALAGVTLAHVIQALKATPLWAIALAAAFTAASHLSLAIMEWLALRAIGRAQSWRSVLPRAMAANALSIVIGFGLASGTALRVRLYRATGLSSRDIAKLVVLTTAATWLSGLVCLGLALLAAPASLGAALRIPTSGVVILGLALLAPAALWLATFRRGRRRFRLRRTGRLLALTANLGDWLFSGAALFVLTLSDPRDFPRFLAVFSLGSLLGGVTQAPGGVGVLEATVLNLHHAPGAGATLAALFLYRLIYLLAPAAIALAGLALRRLTPDDNIAPA